MLFHAHKKESAFSCIGALLLALYASSLALPQVAASLPVQLKSGSGPPIVETVLGIVLFYGLLIGFLRHRDATPLLFAILGLGVVMMYSLGNFPIFLPLLCACCFIIAGIWDILLPTEDNTSRVIKTPRLDAFLDNTLLPPEEHEAEAK